MIVKVLMVSGCNRRGKGPVAYIGELISNLKLRDKNLQVDIFVTSLFSTSKKKDFEADHFIFPQFKGFWSFCKKIPRIRVWIWNVIVHRTFCSLLKSENYDYIVFHSIPNSISKYVKIAKTCGGTKIILYPWGSEILRASVGTLKRYQYAFENADYIRGDSSALCKKIDAFYHVKKNVYQNILYGSSVISNIKHYKGLFTKEELAEKIGIPKASFFIVCGYNAYDGQCHKDIIKQISIVKDKLPKGYLLVFPMTYGEGPSSNDLKKTCDIYGLQATFLTEYISDEKMAYLHLITDLFIHVQKTDLASSYLTEAIYAEADIINGSWLSYPNLQSFGNPYYETPSIEELHNTISNYLDNSFNRKVIDVRLLNTIEEESWEYVINNWVSLFHK